MWYNIFKKEKGENMSDTENKAVKKLRDDVMQQHDVVSDLMLRINHLKDEVELLKGDLLTLRNTVTEDIKYLYEK